MCASHFRSAVGGTAAALAVVSMVGGDERRRN